MALSTHQLNSNQDIGSLFFKHPSNIFFLVQVDRVKLNLLKRLLSLKKIYLIFYHNVLFGVTRNGKNLIISYKNVRGQTSNLFKVFPMMKMKLSLIPVQLTW